MWQRLCDILGRADGRRVLLLGDFMLDRYLYGDAERISPEAPVPVLRVVHRDYALGGAGSVAADIAALGATPVCIGVVGNCPDGDRLAGLLASLGADVTGLTRLADRKTTRKTRLVGLAQHKHRQQLIRIDDETVEPIDEAAETALLRHIEAALADAAVLCIEDYHKGVVTPRLAQAAIAASRGRGVPVLIDPASIDDYSRYAGGTIITPNRTETEKATGLRLRSIEAVRKHAERILAACHTEYVCVTLDADGAALIGPGGTFEHLPTKKRDVYDVTGAGDEVLAAMATALASGAELREAVMLANIAGGLEVEKFGCVPITREEMIGEILLEHHRTLGKVRTIDQIGPELARRRSRGEKIVFTNGCFDLVHAGHVRTFAFCKEHGDVLVLGLNSDASVRRLDKGDGRPIVGENDRAAVLSAMSDVDYIIVFDEDTPAALIDAIQPDVLVKGADWRGRPVAGQETVLSRGGEVLFVPLVEGLSTSNIVERIRGGAALLETVTHENTGKAAKS